MTLARPRSPREILIDRYLFLYAVKESEKKGWLGSIKTQKIVFYSEYLMNQRCERGFNLLFRRYKWGPYSDDLKEDIKQLSSVDFVRSENDALVLGELGDRVLADTSELLDMNRWAAETINESASKFAPMETEDALRFVYPLPVKTRYGETVEAVPDGGTIIKPLPQATKVFELDEDWEETLDILMNPVSAIKLYRMIDNTPKSRFLPFTVD